MRQRIILIAALAFLLSVISLESNQPVKAADYYEVGPIPHTYTLHENEDVYQSWVVIPAYEGLDIVAVGVRNIELSGDVGSQISVGMFTTGFGNPTIPAGYTSLPFSGGTGWNESSGFNRNMCYYSAHATYGPITNCTLPPVSWSPQIFQASMGNFIFPSDPTGANTNYALPLAITRQSGGDGAWSASAEVYVKYYGDDPPTDEVVANFTVNQHSATAPAFVEFTDTSTGPVTTWDWYIEDNFLTNDQHTFYTFDTPGSYTVKLVVNEGQASEDEHTEIINVGTAQSMIRPFTAADEGILANGMETPATIVQGYSFANISGFSNLSTTSAVAFSSAHAIVHAAEGGTVQNIYPLNNSHCNPTEDECYVLFDGIDLFGTGTPYSAIAYAYDLADVYVVTIQVETNRHLRYFVTNPFDYLHVGMEISEGCPLGESIEISKRYQGVNEFIGDGLDWIVEHVPPLGFIFDPNDAGSFIPPANAEFTIVQQSLTVSNVTSLVPVAPYLTEYPEDEPRTCDYVPSACLNTDPELRQPERWAVGGNPEFFSGGGVTINPGDWIEMQLSLDDQTNYVVEIWARLFQNGSGAFAVQIGQTTTGFNLSSNQYQQTIVPSGTHDADLGLFYTFAIRNTGSMPIFVQSACVRDENNGSARPQTCYFANHSFDGLPGTQSWTTTGSVTDGLIPGEILMYDDDTIAQNAILFPDGVSSHIYFVSIIATVGGADFATLSADFTSEVGLQYEYPVGNGFEGFTAPNSSTLYAVGAFFTGSENGINRLPNYEVRFFAEVPVSSLENSDFTIKAIINSANPNLHLRVREVCIDDPFDHHDEPDAWIPPPPFQPNCVGIPTPDGNEISAWLFYHWSQLDRFFQCDLMVLLNKMHDAVQKVLLLIGWLFRYWQATAIMVANWFTSDLVGWLNGHFANMAIGQVTTIENNPDANLWDVLIAFINLVLGPIIESVNEIVSTVLSIIHQAAALIFTILTEAITLALAVIAQALNLLLLGQLLLGSIITAYNTATPTPIPGMTFCDADPQGSAWCIAMWVMENTIFSGNGAFIIPVLVGILSIHLILWVVGELKRTVIQTGTSV